MIPNTKDRALTSSPIAASAKFGISLKDSPFIMSILRDQIYSDKILAVLREYSANAWDANRMGGKGDRPIKVVIPTSMEPTLSIRDYGPGLSLDDVLTVYTQYGNSTKRNNADAVGMLGIGSKSGFAYSDQFTVTSWFDGKKSIYVAALDESDGGVINLIHEEDSTEETGIEVSIAVRSSDVLEFHNKAKALFEFFEPRPEINIELAPPPSAATRLENGFITDEQLGNDVHQWVAVMGCVPYRINLDQVRAFNNNGNGVAEYLVRVSGALNFKIGEVQISASREELKYSDRTKQALIEKYAALVDEFVVHTLDGLENGTLTYWERRLKAMTLSAMKLPIPKKYQYITKDSIEIKHEPKTFRFTVHGSGVTSIAVDTRSKIVLRDDDKLLSGYHLDWRDYLVEKSETATWPEVEAEISEMLKAADIFGLPIEKISTRSWWTNQKQKLKAIKSTNKKHLVSTFEFLPTANRFHPWSACWDITAREPEKEDVYVLLKKFRTDTDKKTDPDSFDFYELYKQDEFVAKQFKTTLPKIYGYKTTDKTPFDVSKIKGVEYRVWRSDWIKSLMTKPVIKLFNYWEWVQSPHDVYYRHDHLPSPTDVVDRLARLYPDHPVTSFFKKVFAAKRIIKKGKLKHDNLKMLSIIKERVYNDLESEYDVAHGKILETYPLLRRQGMQVLWDDSSPTDDWFDYIELIDNFNKLSEK